MRNEKDAKRVTGTEREERRVTEEQKRHKGKNVQDFVKTVEHTSGPRRARGCTSAQDSAQDSVSQRRRVRDPRRQSVERAGHGERPRSCRRERGVVE